MDMNTTLISSEAILARAEETGLAAGISRYLTAHASANVVAAISSLFGSPDFPAAFYKLKRPDLSGSNWGIGYISDPVGDAYTYASGPLNVQILDHFWRKHRMARSGYRVLDFGCGTGRLLRFPCEFGVGVEMIGCEVNPAAVQWLQQNFPCPVHRIKHSFDTSFLDEPVDLIYAWSIFTHFREQEHHGWLRALADKLNPGGLLLATFKSTEQIKRLRTDDAYRKASLASEQDVHRLEQQAVGGFAFFECYDQSRSADFGIDASGFGQAYVSPEYIRARWRPYGDVIEIGVAAEGWQDIVVLRKREEA